MTTALLTDERDDATLARAAADGDRTAFAAIYDRYANRLHDFCIGMLRDRDAAADCVQDVFVIAATKLIQLREADRLRSWLYAIARSEALSRIRARRREQPSEELPEMASAEPELATLAARSELADLINDACGGLSDRDRTVFELAYRQDLAGPELAEALGVTHKNANTLVERLRETIARSLGALLVCRRAKADPARCPELAALLDDWDGRFTVLMRKRVARHIDGCPVCEDERVRMVTPAALLGSSPIVIPAPAWLRDRTLSQSPLGGPAAGSSGSWWPQSDFDISDVVGSEPTANAGDQPIPYTRGRVRAGVGVGLVLIGIAGGALLATSPTARVVPTDAPGLPSATTTLPATTTPSPVQRSLPPSVPPVTTAPTSAPEFSAPPTEATPDEPTAVPRTRPPSTTDQPPPSRFEPSPVNPRPQQDEPQQPANEEPDNGPSEQPPPPTKKVVPTIEQQTPKNQSPKQSPDECTPQNPCDSGPPVFS
jgi:RNA polymerase sigma factor (sigma-70 family)